MNTFNLLVLIASSMFIGFVLAVIGMHKTFYSGWLNVIKDTDDGPYFYLEFVKHPTDVMKKGYVLLKLKEQSRKK